MLMPVIKSAKKKLRQDKKRTLARAKQEEVLKDSVKKAKSKPSVETVRLATQAADKAAKKHIIHSNKAARIKSTLSKLIGTSKGSAEIKTPKAEKSIRKASPKKASAKKSSKK